MHVRIVVPLLVLIALVLAAATAPPDKDAFDEAMETASRQLRTMRRTKFDPKSQLQNLDSLQTLEMALMTAKANMGAIEMSPKAKEKYGSDALAYRNAFRGELVKALQLALEIEVAVLAGKADAATAAFRKLGDVRDSSHDLFEPPAK